MHNDRVEVLAAGLNDRGRRMARLLRRTADAPKRIGGIWHSVMNHGRVEPEDPGHWYSVEVPRHFSHGAKDGDNVVVDITRRPHGHEPAHGRVVEILTDVRPSDLAARFAILRHDLPKFPVEVLHQANVFEPDVLPAEHEGREDLRELPLVTIDGADARDFDHAVYAERIRGGGWRLVVAIADVSRYARFGTALDGEARARATSVYFPDRVLPMLPEHLSNHLCSLMPQVERLSFVCDMRVNKAGQPGRARFYEAAIRSHARLTYDQAWQFLEIRKPLPTASCRSRPRCAHPFSSSTRYTARSNRPGTPAARSTSAAVRSRRASARTARSKASTLSPATTRTG